MVKLLNPPTPRSPPKSHSDILVTDHEKRIEAELAQLLNDIRRIGPTHPPGSPHVLFGELFDDDQVQQYYEALVGTLKCAKKRGVITFKGQMLLKGMHDDVVISIVGVDDQGAPTKEAVPAPKQASPARPERKRSEKFSFSPSRVPPAASSPVLSTRKSDAGSAPSSPNRSPSIRVKKGVSGSDAADASVGATSTDVTSSSYRSPTIKRKSVVAPVSDAPSSPHRTSPQRTSPIVLKRRNDIAGTASDGEAEAATRKYVPVPAPMASSDSEADGTTRRTPRRGRVTLPAVFLERQQSMSSLDVSGRPPAPWRLRKAKSAKNVMQRPVGSDRTCRRTPSNSPLQTKHGRKVAPADEAVDEKDAVVTKSPVARKKSAEPPSSVSEESGSKASDPLNANTKENDGSFAGNMSPSVDTSRTPPRSDVVKSRSNMLSREASFRVDSEIHQLVKDICRVGSNPGEPSVSFGELFDDEIVQQTYEALVGTLRSAKRQGFIKFQGQMLFKGMHDDVTIYVVEDKRSCPEAAA